MKNSILFFLLFLGLPITVHSQVQDTIAIDIDSVATDSIPVILSENNIQNPKAVLHFLEKLKFLQQNKVGKINIIHIGDSHIQADLMTMQIRKNFQKRFGNAGRGFVFPHNLARTNGSWDIQFSSSANWSNRRLIYPNDGSRVGLSGIALSTKSNDFFISFNAKEEDNFFKTIKVITPKNESTFTFSTEKKVIATEKKVLKKKLHKIKKGEAISIIADKYNISVSELKRFNRLKSDNIRAGKTLKIPSSEQQIVIAEKSQFVPLLLERNENYHFYNASNLLEKIYVIPNSNQNEVNLNGFALENGKAGVLYHNIGVNGAKFSDYNKYTLFFEQLKALEPDLIVLSLGTNESFDKMNAEDYFYQLNLFTKNAKNQNPNAEILIITPPASLFKRKYLNNFVADYASLIRKFADENNYAVWDLFVQIGGKLGVKNNFRNGILGNDRVHYTKKGYELQGDLFYNAIQKTFDNYIINNN